MDIGLRHSNIAHVRRRRKVAHLTSAHPAWDVRIAFRECGTLAAAGYEVVLIAAGGTIQALPEGVVLRSVPLPRNRWERMTRTVWNVLRSALAENADVYHFHDPELAGAGLILRALGRKVVFDVHEDIPKDIIDKPWIPAPMRRPIAASAVLVLKVLENIFSAIVTATPSIARRFKPDRTVIVSNYPRLEDLPLDATDAARREDAALYLGSITRLRCIDEMVQAMARPEAAPHTKLLLAGKFDGDALERSVRALPGWERVDFRGQCSRPQVKQLLAQARVGLLLYGAAANHDECVPNKLFEYLGAGLPVIVGDTMQCAQIVEDERCGIVVDPRDVRAIAQAIDWIMKHPQLAQEMGERGRRVVLERYQWSSEAEKLTSLYARIA
jgi:glycosyltransferase involved in cell wall biosynthesis